MELEAESSNDVRIGEIFEPRMFQFQLSYNPCSEEVKPSRIVELAGHKPENWQYIGPRCLDKTISCEVILKRFGYIENLKEAERRVERYEHPREYGYRLLEAQAFEALNCHLDSLGAKFVVMLGGSLWLTPNRRRFIAQSRVFEGERKVKMHHADLGFEGDDFWALTCNYIPEAG